MRSLLSLQLPHLRLHLRLNLNLVHYKWLLMHKNLLLRHLAHLVLVVLLLVKGLISLLIALHLNRYAHRHWLIVLAKIVLLLWISIIIYLLVLSKLLRAKILLSLLFFEFLVSMSKTTLLHVWAISLLKVLAQLSFVVAS